MILLTILGWLLLILLAVVILLLVMPVYLRAQLCFEDENFALVEYRPGGRFGPRVVRIDSRKLEKKTKKSKAEAKTRKKERKRRRKDRDRGRGRPGIETVSDIAASVPKLIEDTIGKFHIHRFRGEFSLGFGDPAETGKLYGRIASLTFPFQQENDYLTINPDFDRIGLHGNGEIALSFVPITLTFPAIRLGWKVFVLWR